MSRSPVILASHRGGNIGHDLMACGVTELVLHTFGRDVPILHLEQHNPFELYPDGSLYRSFERVRFGRRSILCEATLVGPIMKWMWRSARDFREARAAIACGGPNVHHGVSDSVNVRLMYEHMLGGLHHQGVPTIDLAVGSCYPLEKNVDAFPRLKDRRFFEHACQYLTATTVRDPLAEKLLTSVGHKPRLIPCAALLSGYHFEELLSREPTVAETDKFVVINYQEKGANEDWGQNVDSEIWRQTVRAVALELMKRHKVSLLCQNQAEEDLADTLELELPRFCPKTIEEYARFTGQMKAGLVSRIHAAIPLAGVGVPSVVIGTDTRLWTVREMGLKIHYVKEAKAAELIDEIEVLLSSRDHERERLLQLRLDTRNAYRDFLLEHATRFNGE